MKLSAKGRYALMALVYMAEQDKKCSVAEISAELEISKIYLEQVFSALKGAGIVLSEKGTGGGYRLSRAPQDINMYDILSSTEASLQAEAAPQHTTPGEKAVFELILSPIDSAVIKFLSGITLKELMLKVSSNSDALMYYI